MVIDNFGERALAKLAAAKKPSGQKEGAVFASVVEALRSFAGQDEEFAQAIVQGGTVEDCIRATVKGVGGSISDLECYRRAVRFYFAGADVEFQMSVNLNPASKGSDEPEAPAASKTAKVLSLTDIL